MNISANAAASIPAATSAALISIIRVTAVPVTAPIMKKPMIIKYFKDFLRAAASFFDAAANKCYAALRRLPVHMVVVSAMPLMILKLCT